jgi:hypothetical protein
MFNAELNLRKVEVDRNRCMPDPFIAQARTVTLCLKTRQVIPEWLEAYYGTRVFMARYSE